MVPADSDGISRAPPYLGACQRSRTMFNLRDFHPLRLSFPEHSITFAVCNFSPSWQSGKQVPRHRASIGYHLSHSHRFRLFRFRSPLLSESRLFYFPGVTEMVQFTPFALSGLYIQPEVILNGLGFPIRKSSDLRLLAPPRGLSQLTTSFIACVCQGIRHAPLIS